MRAIIVLGLLALATPCALAEEPPFATSRPGQTEGPVVVPKGYFQVETEIAGYAQSKGGPVKTSETRVAGADFRYGIGNATDVEMIVSPYLRDRARDSSLGAADTAAGFGDVTLRARHMFAGADGNGPTFSLIGFVTLPTSKDGLGADEVEGGLIATGAANLTPRISLTLTLGAAAIHEGGYEGDVEAGANLTFAVTDRFGVYVEGFAEKAAHDDAAATLDAGATYLLGPTTQLDAGANFGVTGAADDVDVFIGWAHRF
jgi:hypothetical protein